MIHIDATTAGVGVFILFLLAGALWWWVPKWQMRSITTADPKDRADIEDNFRKTIGQALGGIAVLIGAGIAYYGTQQTLQTNRDQAEHADRATHDQLISQQVAKGFELLGQKGDYHDDKMVLRLGGVYALEGVMNDPKAEQYRQPVLEALCAFVRDRTKNYKGDDQPPTDIQAVLTVIRRRKDGAGQVDLRLAQIPLARLTDADLTDANLSDANLSYAHLTGANLTGANLTGAHLTGATLTGADLTSTNVTQDQLNAACGVNAKLPPGLTLKPCPAP